MQTESDQRWVRRTEAAKRRRELKQRAVEYLGGRCQIPACGYTGSPLAFDFHHVNPMEKDFEISSRMTSWGAIQKELDKCVLLCSRCHREVHDGYHPRFLVSEDDRGMVDEDDSELFEEGSIIFGGSP